MQTHTVTLLSKKIIADRMIELQYTRPDDFAFQAGQFIQVMFGNQKIPIFRSYSISSTPTDEYIELCVKLYDNGVGSEFFTQANIGESMTFRGPAGRFVCDSTDQDILFIATGAGLAPIMSMLRNELENKQINNFVHLIFGVRHEKDIFWTDRLQALHQSYPHFTYTLTISRPESTWTGHEGRVTKHLPPHIPEKQSFLCGSADMVKTVRQLLIHNGTPPESVHFEIF